MQATQKTLFILLFIAVFAIMFIAKNANLKSIAHFVHNSPSRLSNITEYEPDDTAEGEGSESLLNLAVPKHKSFKETFQTFPWKEFENVASKKGAQAEKQRYSELFIDNLTYFLTQEPLIPINSSCEPPLLLSSDEIDCSKFPKAFNNGVKRRDPVKIGTLLQLGFDVDILEIHLNELYGITDQFFIIESTNAHFGKLKKPLIWELVKKQERFKKFPVIHFIVDDAEIAKVTDKQFEAESFQERRRWEKFIEWNEATKYFNDDDIIGFGDTDEIPSRTKLHLLKYCEIPKESIDFGIWFTYGHISQIFKSDYPVKGHPLTLGDPTYFKIKAAKAFQNKNNPKSYPNRRRGGSPNYLLGGIHMTHYGYLPFQLVKRATATEEGLYSLKRVKEISNYFKSGDIRAMEIYFGATPSTQKKRIKPVNLDNEEMKEICILPWFYECNRKRYPVWEDEHDTRLD